jgi:tRNA dimethylallyltransferase
MDIGTAKPALHEQRLVRHHMIDLVEPSQVYTAALYREEGERVLRRLAAERKPAFVTGGTGFYIQALLDGLALPPVPPDPELRARLRSEAREQGPLALWKRLEHVDPRSAARIHPNNLPRTVRALEVVEKLGGPVPAGKPERMAPALFVGLTMERERLHTVADARVVSQVEAGLLEETRLLLAMGYDPAGPALGGFGYREMVACIDGRLSLADAISAYQTATRRYIRRQMTWFRADSRIHWFDVESDGETEIVEMVRSWFALKEG